MARDIARCQPSFDQAVLGIFSVQDDIPSFFWLKIILFSLFVISYGSRCPRLDWWQGTDPEFVLVWNLHRNRSTGARNPLNSDHQPVMTSQIRISSADCWYPIGQNTGGGALIGPVNALSSAVCCCTCCTYSVGNNCEQTLRQIIK